MLAQIATAINVAALVAGVFCILSRRSEWLLALLIAGTGLAGFKIPFLGIIWSPDKVILLCCLVGVLTNTTMQQQMVSPRAFGNFAVVVLLVMAWGLVSAILFEAPIDTAGVGLQSKFWRPIVQTYHYATYCCAFVLTASTLCTLPRISRFINRYLAVVIASAVVGYVQLAAYGLGLPFLPIQRGYSESESAVFTNVAGEATYRLYGVAGEPKNLAALLLPVIVALLVILATRCPRPGLLKWAGAWVLLITPVFFLTFSTAALLAFALAIGGLMLVSTQLKRSPLIQYFFVLGLLSPAALLAASAAGIDLGQGSEVSYARILFDRTIGRITREGADVPEGRVLFHLLNTQPDSFVTGLGPGMYVFHVPGMIGALGVQPVRSGWLVLLFDYGLIGVAAIAIAVYVLIRRAARKCRAMSTQNQLHYALQIVAMGGLLGAACMTAGVATWTSLSLFGGLAWASSRIGLIPSSAVEEKRPLVRTAGASTIL